MATINRLPLETTRLLRTQAVQRSGKTPTRSKLLLKSVCIWSPAVTLIFAWTFVIGSMYEGADIAKHAFIEQLDDNTIKSPVDLLIGVYGSLL